MTYVAENGCFEFIIFEALLIILNKITLLWTQAYKVLHPLHAYTAP